MGNPSNDKWRFYGPAAENLLGGDSIRPEMNNKKAETIIDRMDSKGELLGPEFMKHHRFNQLYKPKLKVLAGHIKDGIVATNAIIAADKSLSLETKFLSAEDEQLAVWENRIVKQVREINNQKLWIIKQLSEMGIYSDQQAKDAAEDNPKVQSFLTEKQSLSEKMKAVKADLPNQGYSQKVLPAIKAKLKADEQFYKFKKIQAYMGGDVVQEAYYRYVINAVPQGYMSNGPSPTVTKDKDGKPLNAEFISDLFDSIWDELDSKHQIPDADEHLYFYNTTQTPLDRFYDIDSFFVLGGNMFKDGRSRILPIDISTNPNKPAYQGVVDLRIDGSNVEDLAELKRRFTEKILSAIVEPNPTVATINKLRSDVVGGVNRIGLSEYIEANY